jgi:hypothetical protein
VSYGQLPGVIKQTREEDKKIELGKHHNKVVVSHPRPEGLSVVHVKLVF